LGYCGRDAHAGKGPGTPTEGNGVKIVQVQSGVCQHGVHHGQDQLRMAARREVVALVHGKA